MRKFCVFIDARAIDETAQRCDERCDAGAVEPREERERFLEMRAPLSNSNDTSAEKGLFSWQSSKTNPAIDCAGVKSYEVRRII